jgi:hypothetical protein
MVSKLLIISGVVFWLVVGIYVVEMSGFFNKSKQTCALGQELIESQAGGKIICVNKPKDAGKVCTKSSECESKYCVTEELKAKKGVCLDSNYYMPCIKGYWTIERAQTPNPPARLCVY